MDYMKKLKARSRPLKGTVSEYTLNFSGGLRKIYQTACKRLNPGERPQLGRFHLQTRRAQGR